MSFLSGKHGTYFLSLPLYLVYSHSLTYNIYSDVVLTYSTENISVNSYHKYFKRDYSTFKIYGGANPTLGIIPFIVNWIWILILTETNVTRRCIFVTINLTSYPWIGWTDFSYLRFKKQTGIQKDQTRELVCKLMFYIFVLGSQTSLLESLETDESNFKEKILHLLTDEPKQDKVNKIQKFRLNIDKVV